MAIYTEINGFTVWQDDGYEKYKGKHKLTGTVAAGMCLLFSQWLRENSLSYDTAEDVHANTSGIRDGNRIDIHEEYDLSDDGRYQVTFLWGLENGLFYAEVWDKWNDEDVGYIEITSC